MSVNRSKTPFNLKWSRLATLLFWISIFFGNVNHESSSTVVQASKQNQDDNEIVPARIESSISSDKVIVGAPKAWGQILRKAAKKGLGGGVPGAIAGFIQVLTLMWLRTISNYQYRYGTSFWNAFVVLYNNGGWPRLYRGLSFAIVQAPLSRFVSTAANDGIQFLLKSMEWTKTWGAARSTMVASLVVGLWRMALMPIDTCKTVLQVDSFEGFRSLMRKVRLGNFGVLYEGAFAQAFVGMVGHYPWFFMYNLLSDQAWVHRMFQTPLLRNAMIGLASSVTSDTCTNFIKVIKTTKQAIGAKQAINYSEAVRIVLAADGWKGLFGRGLRTKIMANALQSMLFTVMWRTLAEYWGKAQEKPETVEKKNEQA